MLELKASYTIVIVTHNMQQAARVSDYTGFMLLGELVEFGVDQGAVHRAQGSARPRPTSRGGSARSRRTAMERHFEDELQAIREKLLAMGSLGGDHDPHERAGARSSGTSALVQAVLARRAGDGSPTASRWTSGASTLLALQQPMAARPPLPRGQHQDQQRPGADGRPGGEHRASARGR